MMKYFATEYVVRKSWMIYWVYMRYPEENYTGMGLMNVVFKEKKLMWCFSKSSATKAANRLIVEENYKKKHYNKKKGSI